MAKNRLVTRLIALVISSCIHIPMLVIGSTYPYCNFDALSWLKVVGAFGFAVTILNFVLASICKDEMKDGWSNVGLLIAILNVAILITQFSFLIWGSVIIFSEYSTWTYDSTDILKNTYCNYTPYVMAFVYLILSWCLVPVLCICFSCFGAFGARMTYG